MNGPVIVYDEGSAPDLSGTEAEVLTRVGAATWWMVRGRDRNRCRVVTTLLHGNEPSGFRAIRAWLEGGTAPAVDTALCLCSIEAALGPPLFAHRMLAGGRDQNRCFLPPFDGFEGRRARAILDLIERCAPEAVVDLHNNTGHSPAYGVGTRVDRIVVGIAALFADRFMHSDIVLGTLTEALDGRVPSVVIECGRAGDPVADAIALSGLERFLTLEDMSTVSKHASAVEVLERPLRVRLREDVSLAFGTAPVPGVTLTVRRDVDRHNFKAMKRGDPVGWVAPDAPWPLVAHARDGVDVSRELFVQNGTEIQLRRDIVPVMMTTLPDIAKADCLFYALSRRRS